MSLSGLHIISTVRKYQKHKMWHIDKMDIDITIDYDYVVIFYITNYSFLSQFYLSIIKSNFITNLACLTVFICPHYILLYEQLLSSCLIFSN